MAVATEKLVDLETGLVNRAIYSDPEIYQLELERVFGKCWLFLAHDTMLPKPGDYLVNYMGEENVIVCRDPSGKVRAFLNTCPHRGNKVCMFDRGHAVNFTCGYHGWSFSTEGRLTGVPFFNEAYYGELDKERWGLTEVPNVATYNGMIFGNWDPEAIPLDDYLGELRWYLDNLLLRDDLGGLEVLPGCQRYLNVANWKVASDNFAGDHYHMYYTHAWITRQRSTETREGPQGNQGWFEIALQPAHGLGGVYTNTFQYEADLAQAKQLGPEIEEWVTERYRRLQERLTGIAAKPYTFNHSTCFPNLSMLTGGAFQARGFYLWHPKGPDHIEIWQWAFVERDAPRLVKEIAARGFSRGQSAGGTVSQDDYENFVRVTENTMTPRTRGMTFHFGMKLGHEGRWVGQEDWDTAGLPGQVGPRFNEQNQRMFYGYWQHLMNGGR